MKTTQQIGMVAIYMESAFENDQKVLEKLNKKKEMVTQVEIYN